MGNWLFMGWGCSPEQEDKDAKRPMLSHTAPPNAHDQAVLELKVQRDKLQDYQKKIAYVIERENEIARQKIREGKKKQALLTLKKRKFQEHLLEKTHAQLENLQTMVDSLEFARMEAAVFEGLRLGTRTLNELHSEMSLEAVEELMEDTRAALQHQEEVDARLSEVLSPELQQEVEEELAELQAAEAQALPAFPAVGSHELPEAAQAKQPAAAGAAKPAASPQNTRERLAA